MQSSHLIRSIQALLSLISLALGLICKGAGIDGVALVLFSAAVLLFISAAIEHICAVAVEQAFHKSESERDGG